MSRLALTNEEASEASLSTGPPIQILGVGTGAHRAPVEQFVEHFHVLQTPAPLSPGFETGNGEYGGERVRQTSIPIPHHSIP